MTISFKIKETIAELFAQLKESKHLFDFLDKGDHYQIHDQDFWSYATWTMLEDGSVKIVTAMSDFTYHIVDLPTGGAQVVYEGAYKGLLEQFLLPQMTPEFTAIDTVRTSTGEFVTLACYQAIKGGHRKIRYEGYVSDAEKHRDMSQHELGDVVWSIYKHKEDPKKTLVIFKDGSHYVFSWEYQPRRQKVDI